MAVPSNPQNLLLIPNVNKIELEWGSSEGATGYKIYRSEDGSNYVLVQSQLETNFEDKRPTSNALNQWRSYSGFIGLERGKTYYYKVTAYNGEGESSGVIASSAPITDSPFNGTVRGKITVHITADTCDHMVGSAPGKARLQTVHDWVRNNFTEKIVLIVSKRILFATNGEDLNVLNYLKYLVSTYDYDLAIAPHYAWFPTAPAWSAGIATEVVNLQDCYERCVAMFGKVPLATFAWQYNKDLVAKAVEMGLKFVPSSTKEQVGIDSFNSHGVPYQFYKPSKRCVNIPGDGTPENTFDIYAGLEVVQFGPHRINPEPSKEEAIIMGVSNYPGNDVAGMGVTDSHNNLFSQFLNVAQLMEDSAQISFNKYFWLPCYLDPYWLFMETNSRSGIILSNGDTEMWHMNKQMMLWLKDRYGSLMDFCTLTELETYLDTQIPEGRAMPTLSLCTYNDYPGKSDEKGVRYESEKYHTITRYKQGLDGYIKLKQYARYNATLDEPSGLSDNWSVPGIYKITNTIPAKDIKFVANGLTYSLTAWQTGYGHPNVHEPKKTVSGETLIMDWDIYDDTDTTRLLTIRYQFEPTDYTITALNPHTSVTSIKATDNTVSPSVTEDVVILQIGVSYTTHIPQALPFLAGVAKTVPQNVANSMQLYADAECTTDGSTISNLTLNQANVVERWIKNPANHVIGLSLTDTNLETEYSVDNIVYPMPWIELQPFEAKKIYVKITPTAQTTYTLTPSVRLAVV